MTTKTTDEKIIIIAPTKTRQNFKNVVVELCVEKIMFEIMMMFVFCQWQSLLKVKLSTDQYTLQKLFSKLA